MFKKRKYSVLTANKKITALSENTNLIEESIKVENIKVIIRFLTTKNGIAFGLITNSYFDYFDNPEVYNRLGPIGYKKDLLKRIQEDLERKREKNDAILEAFKR